MQEDVQEPRRAHRRVLSTSPAWGAFDIAVMLLRVVQPAARHGIWLKQTSVRSYSALASSIKISSVPAPHSGSITVLSLNRPAARNALSTQLLSELSGVVEGLHRKSGKGTTRALILASESDDAFCAGADLKERKSMSKDEYVCSHIIDLLLAKCSLYRTVESKPS